MIYNIVDLLTLLICSKKQTPLNQNKRTSKMLTFLGADHCVKIDTINLKNELKDAWLKPYISNDYAQTIQQILIDS